MEALWAVPSGGVEGPESVRASLPGLGVGPGVGGAAWRRSFWFLTWGRQGLRPPHAPRTPRSSRHPHHPFRPRKQGQSPEALCCPVGLVQARHSQALSP